jgi:hypothetical protein
MQHVMTKAVGAMPESDAAVARIGCFIRRALALESDAGQEQPAQEPRHA